MGFTRPVCDPDMNSCERKCRFATDSETGIRKLTNCDNPCECYSEVGFNVDEDGRCSNDADDSTSECPLDDDNNLGRYCPGGATQIAICSSTGTNSYYNGQKCISYTGIANIPDAPYVTDTQTIPGIGRCRLWTTVNNFTGIYMEPGYRTCGTGNWCGDPVCTATCGNPSTINVYATTSSGVTGLAYYYLANFCGPFSYIQSISSVAAKIAIRPHPTLCTTCGGAGQDPCDVAQC